MKKYDIFISYRRSSYDTANLIATRLRAAGYSVFFDMETLRSGKFNEQLYEVIDNCKDFLVVLPPNALDRCVNEDDWVRLEVCRAMNGNKNIVPIMLNGFVWPTPMPVGMEELSNYQAITASSVEYFDLAMERLQKQYLHSKRQLPIIRLLKYAGICISTLTILVAIVWSIFAVLSRDVCLKYATSIAKDAGMVHSIAEQNNRLVKSWDTFNNTISYEHRTERVAALQKDMEEQISVVENNLKRACKMDSVMMEISPYHSFLLSINGINAEEIAASPVLAYLYYTDYLDQLNILRNAVRDPNAMNRRFSTMLFECFEHSVNAYYASVVSELSAFPKKSIVTYKELSKHWMYFPMVPFGEDREYYENYINTENALAEDVMSRFESALEKEDAQLEDIMRKNDELEREIEQGFSAVQSQVDSVALALAAASEVERIQKENEKELAVRREKVKAKEVEVKASEAELDELDKQYIQVYESLKSKCTIEESDDQWYKWGKIRRWGNYLAMVVESRQKLLAQGIYSTSSITPEVAYADMNSILSVYQIYHPESVAYVASAKQFFYELSKGKRHYAGVVVFAFQDNVAHPVFKVGDIVVGYDEKPIKNYDEFVSAYKANNNGVVSFLRLVDGKFEEHNVQIADIDVVGMIDLTE